MPTITEVSRLAKVSKATVSRVLNNKDRVADATRARVLAAIDELGFEPNAFAKSLATNRSNSIGVMANGLGSPHFSYVLRGIQRVSEALELQLIVTDGHEQPDTQKKAIDFLLRRRSDAFIILLEDYASFDVLAWQRHDTPIAIIGSHYQDELAEQLIFQDNALGARRIVSYLIAKGHTRIAHITGPLSQGSSRERLTGYQLALEEAGLPYDADLVIEGNYSEKSGKEKTHALLDAGVRCTAIFAANDLTAAGVMGTLRQRGLAIPEDISVVGYDNITLARCLYPPLTTILSPFKEMGRAAAQLVLKALGYKIDEEVVHRFEPTLVERESVAQIG